MIARSIQCFSKTKFNVDRLWSVGQWSIKLFFQNHHRVFPNFQLGLGLGRVSFQDTIRSLIEDTRTVIRLSYNRKLRDIWIVLKHVPRAHHGVSCLGLGDWSVWLNCRKFLVQVKYEPSQNTGLGARPDQGLSGKVGTVTPTTFLPLVLLHIPYHRFSGVPV